MHSPTPPGARLVERDGERAGKAHELRIPATTIGRDSDNDIVLPSSRISRFHARVEWDGDQFILSDLGSKNGSFVNGRRLTGPYALHHYDLITLPELTLRFEAAAVTVTWKPESAPPSWLQINRATAEVWVDGAPIHLTTKEFLALGLLEAKGGDLVTKDDLAAAVWPELGGAVSDDSIEQLVSRLRRKIQGGAETSRLVTVRALGYRLRTVAT
ncbi:MAG: FHA domain-containing protein [Dehalococcoidia bacterium]